MANSNQDSEARAAVLIQNYYRRYKQVFQWKHKSIKGVLIEKRLKLYIHYTKKIILTFYSIYIGSKWQTLQRLFKINTGRTVKIKGSRNQKTLQCVFKVTIELIKNIKLVAPQFDQVENLRHRLQQESSKMQILIFLAKFKCNLIKQKKELSY